MADVTTMPRGREFTRADLDAWPDDGWRHELIDGSLVMTPAPRLRHQNAVLELAVLLRHTCPPDLAVVIAPFAVALGMDTVVQPDVLVARRADLTQRELATAPVLAVEVLSPSTRHLDLGTKLRRYETAGCPSYWVVDPGSETGPASVTMWTLVDGAYVETASATGIEVAGTPLPWPLTVVPASLTE